jgi:Phage integrase family
MRGESTYSGISFLSFGVVYHATSPMRLVAPLGRQDRHAILHRPTCTSFRGPIRERRFRSGPAGGPPRSGRALYLALRNTLQQAAQRAGCSPPVTCHHLRHTFATEMLRLGVSLPALMQLLSTGSYAESGRARNRTGMFARGAIPGPLSGLIRSLLALGIFLVVARTNLPRSWSNGQRETVARCPAMERRVYGRRYR